MSKGKYAKRENHTDDIDLGRHIYLGNLAGIPQKTRTSKSKNIEIPFNGQAKRKSDFQGHL